MIYHDEQRIQQILLNLQSNALKFTQRGSVTIIVRILDRMEPDINSLNEYDKYLQIEVKNTGVGIERE